MTDGDTIPLCTWSLLRKELGDINEVIRIRTMKTSRQPNGQKKSTKGQTTIYKTHTTLRIEQRYSLLITHTVVVNDRWGYDSPVHMVDITHVEIGITQVINSFHS
jgi:hypothetical protein